LFTGMRKKIFVNFGIIYLSSFDFLQQLRKIYMGDVVPFAKGISSPVVLRPQFVYGDEKENLRELWDYTSDRFSLLKFVSLEFDSAPEHQAKMFGLLEELLRVQTIRKLSLSGVDSLGSELREKVEAVAAADKRVAVEEAKAEELPQEVLRPVPLSRREVSKSATYKQLLLNRVVNTNLLGRVSVKCSGKVYAAPALPSSGNIFLKDNPLEGLRKMVNNNKLRPWFLTRSKLSGCRDCVWQYLCPPVSHIELVLNNHQICFNHESLCK